jgi:hypothetical protein
MWKVVEQKVVIEQKVIVHRAIDKLLDAFMVILAGGRGIVEVNTRVRPDRLLQAAFGRSGCAEQSNVSETLNASTAANVAQMTEAVTLIYRQHSQACQHDYQRTAQVLDVDMTGLPAGRSGEGVTRGYFAQEKKRRGRQLGRVTASWYDEIVSQKLYPGNRQLHASLRELVEQADAVLQLTDPQRAHTVLRIEGGGGETEHINWELSRGDLILVKAEGWKRIQKLAKSVKRWVMDPRDPGREVAFAPQPYPYAKPTQQLLVRTRKQNGTWPQSMLVCNVPHRLLATLGHYPIHTLVEDDDLMFAMLYAYDRRGGAAETQFKADKQGLFLAKRNKRAFAAQQMLVLLAQLAHNLLVWLRRLFPDTPAGPRHFGMLRLVRDMWAIPGEVQCDAHGQVCTISLNPRCPYAALLVQAFASLLAADGVLLNLRQI